MSRTQQATVRSALLSDFGHLSMTDGKSLIDWAGRETNATKIFGAMRHHQALETLTGRWSDERVQGFKGFGKEQWKGLKVEEYKEELKDYWISPDAARQGSVPPTAPGTKGTGGTVTAVSNGWLVTPGESE